jgi:DNA-binding XRE family transcriptional regulator
MDAAFRQAGLGMSQPSLGKVLGVDAQSIARWEKSGKVPKWANRMARLVYEAHADGDVAICRVVNRINDIDRLVNRCIMLEQTARRGWQMRTGGGLIS